MLSRWRHGDISLFTWKADFFLFFLQEPWCHTPTEIVAQVLEIRYIFFKNQNFGIREFISAGTQRAHSYTRMQEDSMVQWLEFSTMTWETGVPIPHSVMMLIV